MASDVRVATLACNLVGSPQRVAQKVGGSSEEVDDVGILADGPSRTLLTNKQTLTPDQPRCSDKFAF